MTRETEVREGGELGSMCLCQRGQPSEVRIQELEEAKWMGVQKGGWASGELHRTRKTNLQFLQPVFIEDLPNYMPNTLLGV